VASPHRTNATSRTNPTTKAQNDNFTRNNSRAGSPRHKTPLRTAAGGRSTPLVPRWTLSGFILLRMLNPAQKPSSELDLVSLFLHQLSSEPYVGPGLRQRARPLYAIFACAGLNAPRPFRPRKGKCSAACAPLDLMHATPYASALTTMENDHSVWPQDGTIS
jgi:hypothetical protein